MLSSLSGAGCSGSSFCKRPIRQPLTAAPQQLVLCCRRSARQQPTAIAAAGGGGDKSPAAVSSAELDEEARIEAIEAASRKAGSKARRQIPIRNVTPCQTESSSSSRAEWKKGQLFPEGWEQMSLGEKITELYLGQRGMLFWATELSWKAAIALGVAWVLFRIGVPLAYTSCRAT